MHTGRFLLIFPFLAAAFYLGVSLHLSDDSLGSYDGVSLGLDLYNLLPAMALAALIQLTSARMAKGMPVVAVGSLVFTGATVYLVVGIITDESSTAALGFLVLPLLMGSLVVIIGLLGLLVHVLRNRHELRNRPFSQ